METCLTISLQCEGLSSSYAALEQDLTSSKEECESLKKNLKRIVEMKRKMEWQRDDAGRQLDDLEEKMEVGTVTEHLYCVLGCLLYMHEDCHCE